MARDHILVLDEGTTGTRALVIDHDSQVLGQSYTEFTQFHPGADRVEHDAEEIWQATRRMMRGALRRAGLAPGDITAIGITNQRATTVVWDRSTGEPITPAIVWQDTRTGAYVDELRDTWGAAVYERTGWALAPVYSALSLRWILENVPGARRRAQAGELAFGTIDSWLIHRLTGGAAHVISASNASVTGSYDLLEDRWYTEWLDALGVPVTMFPQVCDDSGALGVTDPEVFGARVPIASAIADQQAALFAQGCLRPGEVKCTHGTGTFLDMNVGSTPIISSNGLNSLIAWRIDGQTTYGLEGYAAVTGAAVQWLRDNARLVHHAAETETLARAVDDNGGVYFVPAFTGLSAPYWDSYARGMIIGISPGTEREHLVRAALEGIVYSIRDFIETMVSDAGREITTMRADGGASANDFLLQFQADLLDTRVVRPANVEATGLGAAYLAGLATGVWATPQECFAGQGEDTVFTPDMDASHRERLYRRWKHAVDRARDWARE